jgi:peptide/nickel transport system permease protein
MRYHAVRSPANLSAPWRPIARTALLYAAVLSLTFVLLRLAPGDPATFLLPPAATPADAARMRAEMGLDRPIAVQYARWASATLRGDLGTGFTERRPVAAILGDALPVSLALGGLSLALSFLVGVTVGVLQAMRRGTRIDLALTTGSVLLASAPAYWMGLAAIACFTYLASMLNLPPWMRLPAIGMTTPGTELTGAARLMDLARHSILPVTLLAAIGAAGVARYARTSALDLIESDWIRTARAKGLRESAVMRRHLLANLRAPLVTLFALALPGTVAGSVFVETIFGWPGMGRLMVAAIVARDYPVVMGSAAAYAAIVIVANLAAELLLPWADPRVAG